MGRSKSNYRQWTPLTMNRCLGGSAMNSVGLCLRKGEGAGVADLRGVYLTLFVQCSASN